MNNNSIPLISTLSDCEHLLVRWLHSDGPEHGLAAQAYDSIGGGGSNAMENTQVDTLNGLIAFVPQRRLMKLAWDRLSFLQGAHLMSPWSTRKVNLPSDVRLRWTDRQGRCWVTYAWAFGGIGPDRIKHTLQDRSGRRRVKELVAEGKRLYSQALWVWKEALNGSINEEKK